MQARIYADPSVEWANYHVFSRVVNRDLVFGSIEKEHFQRILDQLLAFCGVEAITWCCMGNHFHILLRVPGEDRAHRLRAQISEEELFQRMEAAFSTQYIQEVRWRVGHAREQGNETWARDIIERLKGQMFDLSKFMQMLKRRFSSWFNKRHGRRGTLWEERYGSVLVEDSPDALRMMAAYIDLNPIRAGLVIDPKDYRWCGYAEAMGGSARSRRAISHLLSGHFDQEIAWSEAVELYRCWLFEGGGRREDDEGRDVRPGISSDHVESVLAAGGKLSLSELLRCRVRYFTAGAVVGSRQFIDDFFQANRTRFGPSRKSGARQMQNGEWNGLCTLRNLQKNVIRPPD